MAAQSACVELIKGSSMMQLKWCCSVCHNSSTIFELKIVLKKIGIEGAESSLLAQNECCSKFLAPSGGFAQAHSQSVGLGLHPAGGWCQHPLGFLKKLALRLGLGQTLLLAICAW